MNYLKTQWHLFKLRREMDRNLAFRKANREHFAKLARSDASRKGWVTRRAG